MSAFVQHAAGRDGGLAHSVPVEMQPCCGSEPITVLLVDDDDHVRGFCRSLLTGNGFTVLEAHNGLEALLTSVQHRGAIDLLVTDLEMPGISGIELGWAFNELWPSVNVLYVSGSPRETVGDQLPVDCAFLPKPFGPYALVNAIGDALMRGRLKAF
jgi:DNA-binding NtrC family response regulator